LERLEQALTQRFEGDDTTESQDKLLTKIDKMIEKLEENTATAKKTADAMEGVKRNGDKALNRATNTSDRQIGAQPYSVR
jgi:histidinol dehydrogenase